MNTTAPKHRLTQVDRQRCTANCSVCGPTRIYVQKPDKFGRVRMYCFQKRREIENARKNRLREQTRLKSPNGKPRHLLTEIDTEKMTAICSVCGPTDIRKRIAQQKYTIYMCNTQKRAYAREYKHSHYIPKPRQPKLSGQPRRPYKRRQTGHSLSEIDDETKTATCLQCGRVHISMWHWQGRIYRKCGKAQKEHLAKVRQSNREFIDAYKAERGCRNCGYNANPSKLVLHRPNLDEKHYKISRLLAFGRERLLQELEKRDVYCIHCYRSLYSEPAF